MMGYDIWDENKGTEDAICDKHVGAYESDTCPLCQIDYFADIEVKLLNEVAELKRERDALRVAVDTKDRAHGLAIDREFALQARVADEYRRGVEDAARIVRTWSNHKETSDAREATILALLGEGP